CCGPWPRVRQGLEPGRRRARSRGAQGDRFAGVLGRARHAGEKVRRRHDSKSPRDFCRPNISYQTARRSEVARRPEFMAFESPRLTRSGEKSLAIQCQSGYFAEAWQSSQGDGPRAQPAGDKTMKRKTIL